MPHWLPPLVALLFVAAVFAALIVWRLRFGRIGSGRSYSFEDRPEPPDAGSGPALDLGDARCDHPKATTPELLVVFGTTVGRIGPASPLCTACLQAWLERHSTRCASCDGPICPGMPVAQAWIGAPHPYTHMNFICTETAGLWCGRWGRGRLITLHETEPGTYASGTANAMAHELKAAGTPPKDTR